MRRWTGWANWTAVGIAVVLVGCGRAESGEGGACAAALGFDGVGYIGTGRTVDRRAQLGAPVDGAVDPACNDGGPGSGEGTEARAFAIAGVPTSVAIAEDDGSVYLAPGYLVDLASHPLHRLLHGTDGRWIDRRDRRRCRLRARVTGTLEQREPTADRLEADGTIIGLDGRTRYEVLRATDCRT